MKTDKKENMLTPQHAVEFLAQLLTDIHLNNKIETIATITGNELVWFKKYVNPYNRNLSLTLTCAFTLPLKKEQLPKTEIKIEDTCVGKIMSEVDDINTSLLIEDVFENVIKKYEKTVLKNYGRLFE